MQIKERTLSGVRWTTFSSIILTALQILQFVLIGRFLPKEDAGLIFFIWTIVQFVNRFADMGISNAIIYNQNISFRQLSGLYWVNIFSGIIFCIILSAISPFIASFYNNTSLSLFIIVISFTFIITAAGRQFRVLLQKNLQFDIISKTEVISFFISFLLFFVLIWTYKFHNIFYNQYLCIMPGKNNAVMTYIYFNIFNSLLQAIMFTRYGIKYNKPSISQWTVGELKPFLSFGRFQMGENLINYFNSQIDNFIIPKLLGFEVMAVYNMAKTLVQRPAQLVTPIITKVTFPVMSKLQNDDKALKNIYLKTLHYLSSVNFPVHIFITVFAAQLIPMLYGTKYNDSIIITQILSIYFLIRSTANPSGSLLLAKGRADISFYYNLIMFMIVPILCFAAALIGKLYFPQLALIIICYTFLFMQLGIYYPHLRFLLNKVVEIKLSEFNHAFYKPLLFSLISASVGYLSVLFVYHKTIHLVIGVTVSSIVFVALNFFFNKTLIGLFKELLKIK